MLPITAGFTYSQNPFPPAVDRAKRLKELEQENSKLKRLVAELSLDKQILQDIARGNF
jgi:cell division protein FtsB